MKSTALSSALELLETSGPPRLETGIATLDSLLDGGLARGKISEIWGEASSGRTAVAFALLASVTRNGELAAFIDAFDTFDAASAGQSDIQCNRLLWVRCSESDHRESINKALRTADILSRSKGFGAVILDLAPPVGKKGAAFVPYSHWFRLQRCAKQSPAAFLVLGGEKRVARSAATVSLNLKKIAGCWGQTRISRCRRPLLEGIRAEFSLIRGQKYESAPLYCRL